MDDMNENQTTAGAQGEQVLDQLRRLRRSRDDKVIAGVCGGLGRSLGVDPLLLRIVLAVMVFFAGTGIVLYAVGWLLLPVDDGTPSVGAQAVERGQKPRTQTVVLAVVLAVAIAFGVVGAFGHWDGPVLLSLVLIGLLVWLLRRTATPAAPMAVSPPTVTVPAAETTQQLPPSPPSFTSPPWAAPPAPPLPPSPPRPRSGLFAITVSVALIALGVLAAFDVSGADPAPGAYPALLLAVTGLGLLLGAWFGRARGLVFWGLVLCLVTLVSSVAGHTRDLSDGSVDQRVTVATAAELPTSDEYGAGKVVYDLTGLDLANGDASMSSRIGFGEIVVVVPPDLDVRLDARTGVGGLSTFGSNTGGLDEHRVRTDYGADGPGGATLDLTLYAGFGHLEVRRAAS
jgi:phage shock protein PspC (stress-responsive transcriptional regulator)